MSCGVGRSPRHLRRRLRREDARHAAALRRAASKIAAARRLRCLLPQAPPSCCASAAGEHLDLATRMQGSPPTSPSHLGAAELPAAQEPETEPEPEPEPAPEPETASWNDAEDSEGWALPAGWRRVRNGDGDYYFCAASGESRWERPYDDEPIDPAVQCAQCWLSVEGSSSSSSSSSSSAAAAVGAAAGRRGASGAAARLQQQRELDSPTAARGWLRCGGSVFALEFAWTSAQDPSNPWRRVGRIRCYGGWVSVMVRDGAGALRAQLSLAPRPAVVQHGTPGRRAGSTLGDLRPMQLGADIGCLASARLLAAGVGRARAATPGPAPRRTAPRRLVASAPPMRRAPAAAGAAADEAAVAGEEGGASSAGIATASTEPTTADAGPHHEPRPPPPRRRQQQQRRRRRPVSADLARGCHRAAADASSGAAAAARRQPARQRRPHSGATVVMALGRDIAARCCRPTSAPAPGGTRIAGGRGTAGVKATTAGVQERSAGQPREEEAADASACPRRASLYWRSMSARPHAFSGRSVVWSGWGAHR
jgi:hypothetical protein